MWQRLGQPLSRFTRMPRAKLGIGAHRRELRMHARDVALVPEDLKCIAPFARGHMTARTLKQGLTGR